MNAAQLIFVFAFAFFLPAESKGQKKYTTQKANLEFTSEAELELIRAASTNARGVIDPSTNQFAFSVDVSSFKGFNSSLQREHFNEKYMESEKFPKASFSGKIIEQIDFQKNGSYDVRAKGDLEIHGVKQTRIIRGKILVNDGTIQLNAQFVVPLSDHDISIPTIVSQKIATQIQVAFTASFVSQ